MISNLHNVAPVRSYSTWDGRNNPPNNLTGYDNNRIRLPNDIPRIKRNGLNNPSNEAGVSVVFSSSFVAPDCDWYSKHGNVPGIPLFVNTESTILAGEEIRATVPQLNYYLERAAIDNVGAKYLTGPGNKRKHEEKENEEKEKKETQSGVWGHDYVIRGTGIKNNVLQPAPRGAEGRATSMYHKLANPELLYSMQDFSFYGDEAVDFHRKWAFNGVAQNTVSNQDWSILNDTKYKTRSIVLGSSGNVEIRNMFTTNPRTDDRLFFIVKPFHPAHKGDSIIIPNGECGGPGVDGECIQIMGVSSGDDFDETTRMPSKLLATGSAYWKYRLGKSNYNYSAWQDPSSNERSLDVDYVLRNKVLAYEGFIAERDENDNVLLRPTNDVEDIPQTVVDIYSLGKPIKVGLISSLPPQSVTERGLLEAHRSVPLMASLPLMRITMTPNRI